MVVVGAAQTHQACVMNQFELEHGMNGARVTRTGKVRFLEREAYADISLLDLRRNIYERNLEDQTQEPLHRWIFDHMLQHTPQDSQILEVGAGPGWLWRKNLDRMPGDWRVTVSDFASKMVLEQAEHLESPPAFGHQFNAMKINAQEIPYEKSTFDSVVANHMLYHIPDRDKAIAEAYRVLKPGGYFYASTGGPDHLQEMWTLLDQVYPDAPCWGRTQPMLFTTRSGDEIERHFPSHEVNLFPLKNTLRFTSPNDAVAYVTSKMSMKDVRWDKLQRYEDALESKIAKDGVFRVTVSQGLFVARKPNSREESL